LCQKKVIHVDNPPINIEDAEELELNKKKRNKSREKILNHLKENCQDSYKPQNLKELSLRLFDRIERKKEFNETRKELQRKIEELQRKVKENKKNNWQLFEELSTEKEQVENNIEEEKKVIHLETSEHIKRNIGTDLGHFLERTKEFFNLGIKKEIVSQITDEKVAKLEEKIEVKSNN
jgi:hypothetical protein